METFIRNYINDLQRVLSQVDAAEVEKIIGLFGQARDAGKRIFAIGNGARPVRPLTL